MSQLVNSSTISWSEISGQLSANLNSTLTALGSLTYPPAINTLIVGNGTTYVSQDIVTTIAPTAAALAVALGG